MKSDHITVARGKTFECKDTLKEHGFRFDGNAKQWILDPPMSEEDIQVLKRKLRRIGIGDQVEVRNMRRDWVL